VNEDFLDLLRALIAAEARFLVVGAHAMAVHGVVRATGDLDLWVEVGEVNSHRVWKALQAFGAPVESLGLDRSDLVETDVVWQMGVPPRRIDLLTSIDGVEFAPAWGDRVVTEWSGLRVPVAGLDTLRKNKAATGREKDRLDLELLNRSKDDRDSRPT